MILKKLIAYFTDYAAIIYVPEVIYIYHIFIPWCYCASHKSRFSDIRVGGLRLAMAGVFKRWRSANATKRRSVYCLADWSSRLNEPMKKMLIMHIRLKRVMSVATVLLVARNTEEIVFRYSKTVAQLSKKSLTSRTNEWSSDIHFSCFTFCNHTRLSIATIDCVWIGEFGKNPPKHSGRINWLHGTHNKKYHRHCCYL